MKKYGAALLVAFFLAVLPQPYFFVLSLRAETDESEIKEDIEKVEDKLEREKREKAALEQNLGKIQSSLNVAQQEIAKTKSKVEETQEVLERKSSELAALEKDIETKKVLLAEMVRELYYSGNSNLFSLVFRKGKILESFQEYQSLLSIQEKIQKMSSEINESKQLADKEKEDLEKAKENHEEALNEKEKERADLNWDKRSTQSEIYASQATIGELQSKLSKLKSDLSSMLNGSYDAKDIEDAAQYASKRTGVRKDFLMGMLVVESDLGRYTGGCTYKQVEDGAEAAYKKGKLSKRSWSTFQRRRDIFKDICDGLDYDYKKMKVSCNPANYYGTGGAMGVPQFMPDTWIGYESSISAVTGNNPPDPWDLTDGVVAMAIKLAKVPGVTSHTKSAEKNASKIYLSGTTSSSYNWYADKVQYWADNYERLLD